MSCKVTSTEALDKIKPVKPPIVNKAINPVLHNIGACVETLEPIIVANQANTLIPVGTAIITVAALK